MRKTLLLHVLPVAMFCALVALGLAAPAAAATLKVSSFPSGAQVSIDGVNTGKVTPMNVALTEGDHAVAVQIPGSGGPNGGGGGGGFGPGGASGTGPNDTNGGNGLLRITFY
jgi:uncharacterized membrane protein YgcG